MAIQRLLSIRVALFALLVGATVPASAQNVAHLRIDTVTAKAGDTAVVNVLYTFTASRGHNIHDYVARFLLDTNYFKIIGYPTSGTASGGVFGDTAGSRMGFTMLGTSEIDLTDSILFKIEGVLDPRFADTEWIRWDTNWPVFDPTDSVDSVILDDGWVRTKSPDGHIVIETPTERTDTGKLVRVPVYLGNVQPAHMYSALLRFVIDPAQLQPEQVVSGDSANVIVGSWSVNLDTILVPIRAVGTYLQGDDTIAALTFKASARQDTACLTPIIKVDPDSTKYVGNNSTSAGQICVVPGSEPASVSSEGPEVTALRMYPNPAERDVTFECSGAAGSGSLLVFDAVGRLVCSGTLSTINGESRWAIPDRLVPNAYQVVISTAKERWTGMLMIEPR